MTLEIFSDEVVESYVNFKNKVNQHKFIFTYRGKMSHAVVKNLLSMTEKKIDALQEEETVKRKIFGVMVNCLQTICAEDKAGDYSSDSIFLVSKDVDGFTVFTGRNLPNEMIDKLSEFIDNINQMNRDSLADLHKEKLKELQGIGEAYHVDETILSLINIAKRSGQKISYLTETADSGEKFFSIKVQIK